MRWLLLFALLLPLAARADVAVDDAPLDDPAAEALARSVMKEIRCLVCQNQSIEDSDADLARDLRRMVRERVAAGDDAGEVKAWLVARYGDWVLLDPPLHAGTLALWLSPPLLLLLVLGLALRRARRTVPEAPRPLDEAERRRLARLLDEEGL